MEADPAGGEATAYSPQRLPASFPRQAANITPGAPGTYAFTMGKSLYIFGPEGQECVAGSEDEAITYGQTVSRNEFGINGGIFWSPGFTRLAFYRKDESKAEICRRPTDRREVISVN